MRISLVPFRWFNVGLRRRVLSVHTVSRVSSQFHLKWNVSGTGGLRRYSSDSYRNYSSITEQGNLILMGSPGCGKTTVGRVLGQRLGLPVLDIDDHHLEPYWGMSVSKKLDEVGSDGFVEAEGQALLNFEAKKAVVSLTGSNPMHKAGMQHVAKSGLVVFLDVNMDDILERLERMKVNRIVGQNDGTHMRDILMFRQQFYEKNYDVRIVCERKESPESVVEKIVTTLQQLKDYKGFESTKRSVNVQRSESEKNTFLDVVLQGLAEDGGLFVSGNPIPRLTPGEWSRFVESDYRERALKVLEKWLNPFHDLHPSKLAKFVSAAYDPKVFADDKIVPVRHLGEGSQYLVELFHGPTASFKDAALQLMPQFFVEALKQSDGLKEREKYLVLVATSGDTGGAVLDGFSKHARGQGVGVLVLYPYTGISETQRRQMVSMEADNVSVIGVKGDFDFCQTTVKQIFRDQAVSEKLSSVNCKLSAANSINIGRLLPQVVYHASAYLDLVQSGVVAMGDEVDLCIPTGNFGNILAAYYAKEMGIPFHRLICASNENNVLTEFLTTGCYDVRSRGLKLTSSPAIDILLSSNLERLLYHITDQNSEMVNNFYNDLKSSGHVQVPTEVLDKLQKIMVAGWCNESECILAITRTLTQTGYLLDPHTAVAKHVADKFDHGDRPMLIASTAHPDKFPENILKFNGQERDFQEMINSLHTLCSFPTMHQSLMKSVTREPVHNKACQAKYDDVVNEVLSFAKLLS